MITFITLYLKSSATVYAGFCELPISTVHAGHYKSFDKFRMQTVIDEYLSGQRSMLCPRSRPL